MTLFFRNNNIRATSTGTTIPAEPPVTASMKKDVFRLKVVEVRPSYDTFVSPYMEQSPRPRHLSSSSYAHMEPIELGIVTLSSFHPITPSPSEQPQQELEQCRRPLFHHYYSPRDPELSSNKETKETNHPPVKTTKADNKSQAQKEQPEDGQKQQQQQQQQQPLRWLCFPFRRSKSADQLMKMTKGTSETDPIKPAETPSLSAKGTSDSSSSGSTRSTSSSSQTLKMGSTRRSSPSSENEILLDAAHTDSNSSDDDDDDSLEATVPRRSSVRRNPRSHTIKLEPEGYKAGRRRRQQHGPRRVHLAATSTSRSIDAKQNLRAKKQQRQQQQEEVGQGQLMDADMDSLAYNDDARQTTTRSVDSLGRPYDEDVEYHDLDDSNAATTSGKEGRQKLRRLVSFPELLGEPAYQSPTPSPQEQKRMQRKNGVRFRSDAIANKVNKRFSQTTPTTTTTSDSVQSQAFSPPLPLYQRQEQQEQEQPSLSSNYSTSQQHKKKVQSITTHARDNSLPIAGIAGLSMFTNRDCFLSSKFLEWILVVIIIIIIRNISKRIRLSDTPRSLKMMTMAIVLRVRIQ